MKEEKRDLHEKTDRNTLYRFCSVSGLLFSIACCIALIQEFKNADAEATAVDITHDNSL